MKFGEGGEVCEMVSTVDSQSDENGPCINIWPWLDYHEIDQNRIQNIKKDSWCHPDIVQEEGVELMVGLYVDGIQDKGGDDRKKDCDDELHIYIHLEEKRFWTAC